MELHQSSPPVTVESVRVLLYTCLGLLDGLQLHQAAAYVDMALHATGEAAPAAAAVEELR